MTALRFLIANGYDKPGRDELARGGCTAPETLFEAMLSRYLSKFHFDVIYPADSSDGLKKNVLLSDYDGVIWTGSSLTIHKVDRKVTQQIELARAIFEAQVPQYGSCWGLQLAVVAAGGMCAANPKGREASLARKLYLTQEGRSHPMFVDKPSVFNAFTNHTDEVVSVPPGTTLLASNSHTRVQAVSVQYKGGSFWAVQYHPEYDLHELTRLTSVRKKALMGFGKFQTEKDADNYIEELSELCKDKKREDLSWRFGIDDDVLNPDIRQAEVRNWLHFMVIPNRSKKD